MGMYTRFVLNVAIKNDAPILETLAAMCQGDADGVAESIGLPERCNWMLHHSSYYHDNIQHCSFKYDDISRVHRLSVTCDIKNYKQEIEALCAWLAPYVGTTDLAGYSRYEEDESPSLLWFRNGKAEWRRATYGELPKPSESL